MTAASFAGGERPSDILRVINLAKRYGDERVLEEITFSVTEGDVLGIVGPNGAGKTTLLEVLAGLIHADLGNLLWRGETLPASRRKEAMFYLPDGVRPYRDHLALDVVSFFAESTGNPHQKPAPLSLQSNWLRCCENVWAPFRKATIGACFWRSAFSRRRKCC